MRRAAQGIGLGVDRGQQLVVEAGIGAIRSKRGRVIVLDREKLEELAGDAYGEPESEYRRLIGPFGREGDRLPGEERRDC